MALYTLADLHLATGVQKPMDIFGGRWQGYTEKIIKNWNALIAPEDTVVLGGDISWGISLAEAKGDGPLRKIFPTPIMKRYFGANYCVWKRLSNWGPRSSLRKSSAFCIIRLCTRIFGAVR